MNFLKNITKFQYLGTQKTDFKTKYWGASEILKNKGSHSGPSINTRSFVPYLLSANINLECETDRRTDNLKLRLFIVWYLCCEFVTSANIFVQVCNCFWVKKFVYWRLKLTMMIKANKWTQINDVDDLEKMDRFILGSTI
jgi:hypothetical protein